MVRSAAVDVDGYLAEVAPQRRDVLAALRELCRAELAGFVEEMTYGMPGYRRPGDEIEFAFASQKQYMSLYVRTDVVAAHEARLAGIDRGKGCLRFRRVEQIDMELVRSLLKATAATPGPVR